MDKEFFYDCGITPHLQFEPSPLSTSSMPTWNSLSTAMDIHQTDQPPSDQSSDCFFESALNSMVSTPTTAASNSPMSTDTFMIRELIGKLGSICNNNSGEIPPSDHQQQQPPQQRMMIPQVMINNTCNGGGANNHNTGGGASCYTTPLSSPPKRNIPDHLHHLNGNGNGNGNGNSIPPLSSNLPAMPGDPGFAERAARFSSFGSRSFNGRTSQLGESNQNNFQYRRSPAANTTTTTTNSTPLKLTRVSSSPSLIKAPLAAALGSSSSAALVVDQAEFHNSDPKLGFENGSKPVNDSTNNTCRKRKSVPKGKPKENSSSTPAAKAAAENEDGSTSPKRTKSIEGGGGSNGISKHDTKRRGGSDDAMVEDADSDHKNDSNNNNNQKPPEPPKDYIHVRARRGQATDSHSLAERVRRERISERMKLLQDLVPGCNKVTGKALMLDEIINYVQSLQRQVEFLSMKLSSVNPRLEMSMDNMISKDGFQPNCSHSQPMYPLDPLSSTTLYGGSGGQQSHQNNITNGAMTPSCSQPNHHDMQLPSVLDGFSPAAVSQMPSLCEGDLHSIFQMGYNPNLSQEIPLQSHSLHGSNQAPLMKIEF